MTTGTTMGMAMHGMITETTMTIDELTQLIHQWGADRKIHQYSTALAQSRKTIEEVHELIEAAAKIDLWNELLLNPIIRGVSVAGGLWARDKDKLADAIGDVYVTLVQVAACAGINIHDCIEQAYNEIKDRRGELRADGVFVKEVPCE